MSETSSLKKMIPVIVITWILSLVTTLAIVYFTPLVPIGTDRISDSAITSGKIANGAIITTKLPDGSVTSAKILDGAVTAQDIANGSIITVKVADGAITTAKIADSAINTTKIADNAVVTIKLADGAVTSAKILDGTVTTEDLSSGAITSVKIADGAITTSKISDYAVTSTKMSSYAVPFNSTYAIGPTWTTSSTGWVDMESMSVSLRTNRTSFLLILFSFQYTADTTNTQMIFRAVVGSTEALPTYIYVIPAKANWYSAYSYSFYMPSLTQGNYTIKIQWQSSLSAMQFVGTRTLTVIALPA
jgi:molybdopterin-binding protein